jgi:hypothetical protein
MNGWIWYLCIGLLVLVLVVVWDWYASLYVVSSKSMTDRLIVVAAAIVVVPVWPIVLIVQLRDIAKYIADPPARFKKFKVTRKHLVKRISIQEVERLELVIDPFGAVPDVPFGFLNGAWLQFVNDLRPADSLWVLSARAVNGFQMEERQGYAILRWGRIKRVILTSRTTVEGGSV